MLYWALVFLVVAIIAGALGFGGIAGTSAGIAQILFFVFLAFLVISLLAGLFRRAHPTGYCPADMFLGSACFGMLKQEPNRSWTVRLMCSAQVER